MAVDVKTLKPTSNEITLDRIRSKSSPDYRARVPQATQAGVQATMKSLMEYRPARNEFIDALVNRIGLVLARNNSWSNPLAEFKSGMLSYGDTIEEYHMGLIKAKTYDPDRDSLEKEIFGTNRAEVQSSFHTINRMDKYKITVDSPMLQRAFLESNGLTSFISKTMESITTSDNWDEFLLTCQLFPEYESNGGFHKVQVPDVANPESTAADAKKALRTMRAVADNLTFISTKYNAAKMPMAAKRSDLLLFVTPEFNAAIDVEALAAAFNLSQSQLHGRIIPIPQEQIGIDGVQAIMTTSDFFVIADSLFETTQIFNPDTLQNNHWLHHHQVISASRFVPAVLFTTKPGDIYEMISNPVTAVAAPTATNALGAVVSAVVRGEIYAMEAAVTSAVTADNTNNAVRWEVTGNTSNQTTITQNGILHVSGTENAATLTVRATSVWIDPTGAQTDGKTATKALTVGGPSSAVWPNVAPVTGITVKGVAVSPAFAPNTLAYTVTVPAGTVTAKDVRVQGPDTGDVEISYASNKATIKVPSAPGDPVYTVTVTVTP